MDDKHQHTKYLAIHAHMYQPPRENPFTGEVELEHSAKPYDNWNNRIAMECYFPNLYGRILDKTGEVLEFINNYEYLNFNFGPTLLNWMEIYYPKYYSKLVETVRNLKEKKGVSPAIAQVYNHTILPLDNFSTKITQIHWGIKDFEHRFGFYPEGIWLSETAVNEDVLKILIDYKIKYVILSPHQLSKAINLRTQKEEPIYPNKHYIWFDRDDKKFKNCKRHIYIFAYDGEFSRKVAFDNITFNSEMFVKEISLRYSHFKDPFILIATDGETFGHHHKFADLTLSHAFRYELLKHNIKTVSLAEYISIKEVESEAELATGPDGEGTSWSCAHGVRRWKGGCNCGDEGIYDTSWRFGLRNATKWLSEVLGDIYNEEGKKIFIEPLLAKNNYIDVIRKKISLTDFINQNLKDINDQNIKKAKKLLLMTKYQMFSLTSCGWFFNDISRIETQQNLKYALKAITLAEELGYKGIEKGFVSLLAMSKSNFPEMGSGEKIYQNHIKSSMSPKFLTDAYLSIKTALNNQIFYSNFIYKTEIKKREEKNENEIHIISAIKNMEEDEERVVSIILNFRNIHDIKIFFKYDEENQEYQEIKFSDMSKKMQTEILKLLIIKAKEKNIENLENTFATLYEIFELNPEMAYENLEEDSRYTIGQILNYNIIKFITNYDIKHIDRIEEIINMCEEINLKIDYKISNDITMIMGNFTDGIYEGKIRKEYLEKASRTFKKLNLYPLVFHCENALGEISESYSNEKIK